MTTLQELIDSNQTIIADGGMGTALVAMGLQAGDSPELWNVDNPVLAGPVENQDSYMQSVVSQRPYFFDHVEAITDRVMDEFHQLTGRRYRRVRCQRCLRELRVSERRNGPVRGNRTHLRTGVRHVRRPVGKHGSGLW